MIGGIDTDLLTSYLENSSILGSIPSKTLRDYLNSDEYNSMLPKTELGKDWNWNSFPTWSYMQIATLAYQFMERPKLVAYLDYLSSFDEIAEEEKSLYAMCARDFEKYNYTGGFSKETLKFYEKCFYQKNGPIMPLDELLFFPVIFKPGDVVSYNNRDGLTDYYMVMATPDYDNDLFQDLIDESYLVLNLKQGGESLLNEVGRLIWHDHILPASLEHVEDSDIPEEYRALVNRLRSGDIIKQRTGNTIPSGAHTKDEMRNRINERISKSNGEDEE